MKMSRDELPLRVGISMCLLGEKVRYDAGHKKDPFITGILGSYFEWIPVCPELDVGMGVPREPVRLTGPPDDPRMIGTKSGTDWTSKMREYAARKVRSLAKAGLSGYIFKSGSPSCGMERVRVYAKNGVPAKKGRGLFAEAVLRELAVLPVEEEGRLQDSGLRENFIERVFAYHRLRQLLQTPLTLRALVEFHSAHKYLLLAHSPLHYRQLGQVVARAKQLSRAVLEEEYTRRFMEALRVKSTVGKNVNVLHHILGFLKDQLTTNIRSDILGIIEDYRQGLIPLVVPVTLLEHHVRINDVAYIRNQVYLHPHPKELMLRNHV